MRSAACPTPPASLEASGLTEHVAQMQLECSDDEEVETGVPWYERRDSHAYRLRRKRKDSLHSKAPDPGEDGYCYLHAVRKDSWDKAVRELGFNPYMLHVLSWLQENISVWSSAPLKITYGLLGRGGDGRAYVQAHIEPAPSGFQVRDLLRYPGFQTRLGATQVVQRPDEAYAPGVGPSTRTVVSPSASPVVTVPFYVTLKHTEPRAYVSPRTSPSVIQLTKFFESVELVDFEMSCNIIGGESTTCAFGVSGGVQTPADTGGFLALPMCAMYSGSSQGAGVGNFQLPPDHPFGHEVKAVSVGNPDPTFHWRVDSSVPTVVTIRGSFKFRCLGVGVPAPFQLLAQK